MNGIKKLITAVLTIGFVVLVVFVTLDREPAQQEALREKPSETEESADIPQETKPYKIANTRDASVKATGNRSITEITPEELQSLPIVERKVYQVITSFTANRSDIRRIADEIVSKARDKNPDLDEISIFFYSSRDMLNRTYDIAKAVWAPGGKWGSTSPGTAKENVRTDYEINIEMVE